MADMIREQLGIVIGQCVEKCGAHLIDTVLRGKGGTRVIEVYVDSERGISTDQCSEISREILREIESGVLVDGTYRLEVSSPGIDRPLRFSWQYPKHVGRSLQMKVRTTNGIEERSGTLVSADDVSVVMAAGAQSQKIVIPLDTIVEARIKAPW